KTLPSNANAGGGMPFVASTTTTSTTSPSGALSITISASGDPNDPDLPDLAANIIALPPSDPLSFSGNSPVTQTGGTPIDPAQPCDANQLINCAVKLTGQEKLGTNNGSGNPDCDKTIFNGTPSSQCVKTTYSDGFRPGMNIILAVSF